MVFEITFDLNYYRWRILFDQSDATQCREKISITLNCNVNLKIMVRITSFLFSKLGDKFFSTSKVEKNSIAAV